MSEKSCNKCAQTKQIESFARNPRGPDGRLNTCKDCANAIRRAQLKASPELRAKNAAANLVWRQNNKDKARENNARWYQANRERHRALGLKWVAANPERSAELSAARWAKWAAKEGSAEKMREANRIAMRNPCRRMARSIWGVLRGHKQGRRWAELLGYTETELRTHLERQLLKGMTWDNYGEWHIDHIIPLSSFVITGPECPELRRAWALTNLRPLWAKDNIAKGAKIQGLV